MPSPFEFVPPHDPRLRVPEPPRVAYFVGLDLGQSADFTAVSVLRSSFTETAKPRHEVVHLERFPLGTSYTAIAAAVVALVRRPEIGSEWCLVPDLTGVGRPVRDVLRDALGVDRTRLTPVTITGGGEPSWGKVGLSVPKRDLITNLLVLLEGDRLALAAGTPELEAFIREASGFQVRLSAAGHDIYGQWREGEHDDLVLSVALAAWVAERRGPRRIVRQLSYLPPGYVPFA
jgi:hypothetical protein